MAVPVTMWTQSLMSIGTGNPLLPGTVVAVTNTSDASAATLYTDITGGSIAGSSSATVDSAGNLTIYVAPGGKDGTGRYTFTPAGLSAQTFQVAPVDNILVHVVAAPTGVAATDTAAINNALAALPAGGGKIILQPGVYVINAVISQTVGYSTIEGAGPYATVIRTSSAITMIDSGGIDGMQLRNLTVDGTGAATRLWHPYVSGTLGQHFRTDHVRFINGVAGGTMVDTFGGVNYSIADCRFYDTDFVGGGIGITIGDYDNHFFGCTFGSLTVGGVKFMAGRAGSGGDFYGCIFSTNKVDLLINTYVGPLSFFGCWFENSSQTVLALSTALGQMGSAHFFNCNFSTTTTAGLYLFDLTTAGLGTIEVWGGTFNPSYPAALKLPVNTTVYAHAVQNAELYALTGAGYFIRENSPATQLFQGRQLFSGHFSVASAGFGLQVKEGSNAKQGVTAAMVAGTVTVSNTSVTASSRISYWRATSGGTLGHVSYTKAAGTSFTLTSSSNTETSTFEYEIYEPA